MAKGGTGGSNQRNAKNPTRKPIGGRPIAAFRDTIESRKGVLAFSFAGYDQLAAALYPPIRVVLYENDAGHGVFEYDQPSTTLGQFGDEQVNAVARGLDAALARALLGAAE
jgi:hypothetical protein